MEQEKTLSHLRDDGTAAMVDISGKTVQRRVATATSTIRLHPDTIAAISEGQLPKGDVLAVARIAGIQAAKKTADLIPLCHPLPLTKVAIDFSIEADRVVTTCLVKTDSKTGVEMEALTGASIASLTIYDMCKAIDKEMCISETTLVEKTKADIG